MAGEWPVVLFGAAPIEIIDGDRGNNYPKTSDFSDSGHCLFLNTGNVTANGFDFSRCQFVTEEKDRILRKGKLSRNDVVMTTRGTVGNVAYYNSTIPYENIRINSGMVIFRPETGNVDPRFLYMFLRSSGFMDQVAALRTGSAQPQLPIRDINRIQIPLPPLAEQQAIACILGSLDDKIELNRRMNETLEAMARAIFKSWFVDFDPVRAKAAGQQPPGLAPHIANLFPDEFEESELGQIPKGWSVGTLGDVAGHPRRGVQPDQIDPATPYIALEHMPKRSIALHEWGIAEGLESNKFEFRKGEILYGKLRPYFHKVGIAPIDGVCSTDIVVVAPKAEKWFGFVLGHVSNAAFVEYTYAGSTGTKMPRTSWSEMARYAVVRPPEPVAEAFTKLIRPAVNRIIASIHESRTLAALRDTLLPKLISGELRVPDAEHIVGRCT